MGVNKNSMGGRNKQKKKRHGDTERLLGIKSGFCTHYANILQLN